MSEVIAKKRWYLTADGKVVDEAHPRAAFLLAAKGQKVHTNYADAVRSLQETEQEKPAPKAEPVKTRSKRIPTDLTTRGSPGSEE